MPQSSTSLPLFVDLDGTLIRSDVSYEAFLALIKKNPFYFFAALLWLLRGRPYFKRQTAKRINFSVLNLPYNKDFLEFLKKEKDKGRHLVLASASEVSVVKKVADQLGIFDGVIATSDGPNISGENKLNAMRAYMQQHGLGEEFAYAGNSAVDIAVWKGCSDCLIISESRGLLNKAKKTSQFSYELLLEDRLSAAVKSLRLHQWSKNTLLFVPMLMAHRWLEMQTFAAVLLAFFSFSFSASAIYLVNDMFDIEADRAHPTKFRRPLAAGALQVKTAVMMAAILLILSFFFATFLPYAFRVCLGLYLLTTTAYSLRLKKLLIVDILILAMLYVLRIFAGGMAAGIYVSQWLLSFSLFLFTSLACLKRFSELKNAGTKTEGVATGRGYKPEDIIPITHFGSASGYLAVFVLVFYINSKEVLAIYHSQNVLWFLCPLLMYWITRIWVLAHRGEVHEDPVVFALNDKVSYLVGAGVLGLMALAI